MCKRRVEGILRIILIFLVVAFFLLFLLPSSPPPRSDRMKFFMRSKLRETTKENDEKNLREKPECINDLKAQIEDIKSDLKNELNNEILSPEVVEQNQLDAKKKLDELLQKIRERQL